MKNLLNLLSRAIQIQIMWTSESCAVRVYTVKVLNQFISFYLLTSAIAFINQCEATRSFFGISYSAFSSRSLMRIFEHPFTVFFISRSQDNLRTHTTIHFHPFRRSEFVKRNSLFISISPSFDPANLGSKKNFDEFFSSLWNFSFLF